MNIGTQILAELKNEVTSIEYERYIKQLTFSLEESRSDEAVFYTPNKLIANWIKTKYAKKIAHLFEVHTGVKTKVIIKLGKKGRKKSRPKKEDESGQKSKAKFLNPSLTFDSFIVGDSNQFAYTSALSVANNPGTPYNPLYIYGGVGLGKTHLLQAIGNLNKQKNMSILYTTLEQFLNDYLRHIGNKTMDRFREKFRKCDILLIDDIQFLSNKEKLQEELFHTFNELHSRGKQIVITSDKSPNKIAGIEERLKSRFEWGLITDIQPPELETKIAIIRKKCELDGVNLGKEIINYIATNMGDNIREIEGTILKLNAYSSMMNKEIDLEFVKDIIKDQINEQKENISIDDVIDMVSSEMNIKPSEIKSKSRSKNIANARRVVIYIARNLTPNSTPKLAQYFGMKDHSAISKNIKKTMSLIENDETFRLRIKELEHKIKAK